MRKNLREFGIIVVGVLVALFVDALREEYQERRDLTSHLEDVAAEIEANSYAIRAMREGLLPEKMAALSRVLGVLEDPTLAVSDSAAFAADLALSSVTIRPWLFSDRYEALRSSGQLRLLRDSGLASSLAVFHQAPTVLFPVAEALRGDYPSRVQELLPPELAVELSPVAGYALDRSGVPSLTGEPDYSALWDALAAGRAELAMMARSEVGYATGYAYALVRYQEEFDSILVALEPWRSPE